MAEHIWMVNATGGYHNASDIALVNVNWGIEAPGTNLATVNMFPEAAFSTTAGPTYGILGPSYVAWNWNNTVVDNQVDESAKIFVGVPFSRQFPCGQSSRSFNKVEVFAKYMVSDVTQLSSIQLKISDATGVVTHISTGAELIGGTSSRDWIVGCESKVGDWEDWVDTNLRASLSFIGNTTQTTNGTYPVGVFVEWFAFRLSEEA